MDTPEIPTEPINPIVYNDLLKHYAGLILQGLLEEGIRRHVPNNHAIADVAFEMADAMALAYYRHRRDI